MRSSFLLSSTRLFCQAESQQETKVVGYREIRARGSNPLALNGPLANIAIWEVVGSTA